MKYLKNGTLVEVIGQLKEGGYVVDHLMEDPEYGERYESGNIEIVSEVLDRPPIESRASEIVTLDAKITNKHQELRDTQKEIDAKIAETVELEKRAKLHNQLRYVFDFLDGKITHIVKKHYSSFTIESLEDALNDGDYKPRLISLFGRSKGDLDWRIHAYSDTSGLDEAFVPCRSLEDAQTVCYALAKESFELNKEANNMPALSYLYEAMLKNKLDAPQDLKDLVLKYRNAERQKQIDAHQRQIKALSENGS